MVDDNEFGTQLDPNATTSIETSPARFVLQQALVSGKSPDETATNLQLARKVKRAPGFISEMPPEDKAFEKIRAMDLGEIEKETPVLYKKLGDLMFASLVKEDPREAGLVERLWWKFSPEPGEKGFWWQTSRNAIARGGYGIANAGPMFGNESVLERTREAYKDYQDKDDALKNGLDIAEIFGTEDDPTGMRAYGEHLLLGPQLQKQREEIMRKASISMAWANRMASEFPHSDAYEAFQKEKGFQNSATVFLKNPITLSLELGFESMTRQFPQIAMMGVGAAVGGTLGATLGSGATSYTMERGSRLAGAMTENGLNPTSPGDIMKWYMPGAYSKQFEEAKAKAALGALGTAAFDALAGGLATAKLLPKKLGTGKGAQLAEVGAQATTQGLLGGAGEASAQMLTEGKVTNWADVIAEFAGEFTTSPVDVASVALGRRASMQEVKAVTEAFATQTKALIDYTKTAPLLARDPQTFSEYIQEVKEQNGTTKLFVDVQALHKAKQDDIIVGASPEMATRFNEALSQGTEMEISTEEFLTNIAPRDEQGVMAGAAHPEGLPSLAEARRMEETAAEETVARLSETLSEQKQDFRDSSANVGKKIFEMLGEAYSDKDPRVAKGNMPETMRITIATYLQTLFAQTAKDMGVLPEVVFEKYGPRMFLSPKDMARTADGKMMWTSERAKKLFSQESSGSFSMTSAVFKGTFGDFMVNGTPKERFVHPIPTSAPVKKVLESLGIDSSDCEVQMNNNASIHPYNAKHPLTSEDWLDVVNLPAEATRARVGDRARRVVLRKDRPGKEPIEATFDITYNATRVDAKTRFALKTAYVPGQTKSSSDAATARVEALTDFRTAGQQPNGLHTYGTGQSRPVELDSVSVSLSHSTKKSQAGKGSFPQDSIGDYFPDYRAIGQWTKANRSTFLHETGHMFLNMRVAIARDLLASGEELTVGQKHLVDSINGALKWLGTDLESFAKMSADQQRPMHEKFARTYEAYLMEGHAPNRALTKVFRQFSAWLRGVYKILGNIPNAEMSPEVRQIFDSLLIASNEVETARQRRAQFTRINDNVLAAIATEQGEDIENLREEVREAALEEMTANVRKVANRMTRLRKGEVNELSNEAQRQYAKIYDSYWAEMLESPVYQVHVALKDGVNGEHPKLTEKELEGIKLTDAQRKFLEDNKMIGDGKEGTGAMLVAKYPEAFSSVDAMVMAIVNLGDPVQAVRDKTTARMLELFPDLASSEAIARAADLALLNDAQLRLLQIEYTAFNRAVGNKTENAQYAKETAETKVQLMPWQDLGKILDRVSYERGKNARDCELSRKNGKLKDAAFAKFQEVLNFTLGMVIKNTMTEIKADLKYFNRFSKAKTGMVIDGDFYVAVQDVLAKTGFIEFPEGGKAQRKSIVDFVDDNNAESQKEDADRPYIDVSKQFLKDIEEGKITRENMTVAQFRELTDLVKQIAVVGKQIATVRVGDQEVALQDAQLEIYGSMLDNVETKGKKKLNAREKTHRLSILKNMLERFGYAHARIPMLFRILEGTESGKGKFFDYIVKEFDACGNRKENLKSEFTKKLFDLFNPILKELCDNKPRFYKALNMSLTKQELFVMGLNMGNEGNMSRLLDNTRVDGKKLTQEGITAAIAETFSADTIQRIQGVWDLFEQLRPMIEAKEIRLRGRAPEWVEAKPISFMSSEGKVVNLKGGYYPIVYDTEGSVFGNQREEKKEGIAAYQVTNGNASTWKGFTKTRVKDMEGIKPLTLTLRATYEGFDAVIHDLCWDEWVMSTRRILKNQVENTINDYFGAKAVKAINSWIRDIATDGKGKNDMGDDLPNLLRRGISLAGIGFNLVTAAIQPIGITQSVVVLGSKWAINGISEAMKRGPIKAYQYAVSKSKLMQDRARTQFREMAEIQRYTSAGSGRIYEGLTRVAYMPVMFTQMLVDVPTWIGAYNKALSEGVSDADAVAMADRMLIEAQGSGRMQDLSGIERGNAWMKLFTVFYTFFNTTYNLAMVAGHNEKRIRLARDLMLLLVAQPVLETFLREALKVHPDGDDDKDYWEKITRRLIASTMNFNFGLLVGLREFASLSELATGESPFGYQGPTGTRKITDTMRWVTNACKIAFEDKEASHAFARQTVTVFSEWAGVPGAVIFNRLDKGVEAIQNRKTNDLRALFLPYED